MYAGFWGTTTGGSRILADGATQTLRAMAMVNTQILMIHDRSATVAKNPKRYFFLKRMHRRLIFQRFLDFVNSAILWIIWPDCCWTLCCHAPSNLHGYPAILTSDLIQLEGELFQMVSDSFREVRFSDWIWIPLSSSVRSTQSIQWNTPSYLNII